MIIEVGKTYSLRGGGYVTIERKDEWGENPYTYFGYIQNSFNSKGESQERLAYFTESGRYSANKSMFDIISEYEGGI